MKKLRTIARAAIFASALTSAHAQFTAGNLVVLREGTGSAALSSTSTAISLDQYTTSPNGFVNSVAIPSTGALSLTNSGSAASEGLLSLSANGQYLVISGYNAPAGIASIVSTTSASDPRGVATVDANGNYSLVATTNSLFSANNIRSSTTDGNGNFWSAGANGGVAVMVPGTPALVSTTSVNNRLIQDIGGNLYFSTGSGSTRGIYEINGAPTSGSNTAVSLINMSTLGSVSPYGFAFNSNLTIAYIADSDAYTNSTGFGGIEKWAFNGTSWAFQYSLPTVGTGADGLVADFSGTNPVVYATSADGTKLFDVADTGSGSSATLLDTASTNEAFRGLEFAPQAVPEPTSLSLLGIGGVAYLGAVRRRRSSTHS